MTFGLQPKRPKPDEPPLRMFTHSNQVHDNSAWQGHWLPCLIDAHPALLAWRSKILHTATARPPAAALKAQPSKLLKEPFPRGFAKGTWSSGNILKCHQMGGPTREFTLGHNRTAASGNVCGKTFFFGNWNSSSFKILLEKEIAKKKKLLDLKTLGDLRIWVHSSSSSRTETRSWISCSQWSQCSTVSNILKCHQMGGLKTAWSMDTTERLHQDSPLASWRVQQTEPHVLSSNLPDNEIRFRTTRTWPPENSAKRRPLSSSSQNSNSIVNFFGFEWSQCSAVSKILKCHQMDGLKT